MVGRPESKRPLGRPRCIGKDNIKMGLRYGSMDWINLSQIRVRWRALVNAAMKLRVP
jgi:hypothetical protein